MRLANLPPDIRVCIRQVTPEPLPGEMKAADVTRLITKLRQSEVRKTKCGQRLINLYDAQARRYNQRRF